MTPESLARIALAAYEHMSPWTEAQFSQSLADPNSLLVSEGDAYVLGRVILDEAEILSVACDPSLQRTGRASSLLDAFHKDAQNKGVTRIFLEVSIDNVPARALYEAWDYSITGRRKDYYRRPNGINADALIMSRNLP